MQAQVFYNKINLQSEKNEAGNIWPLDGVLNWNVSLPTY